jgi:hypothetical protein
MDLFDSLKKIRLVRLQSATLAPASARPLSDRAAYTARGAGDERHAPGKIEQIGSHDRSPTLQRG